MFKSNFSYGGKNFFKLGLNPIINVPTYKNTKFKNKSLIKKLNIDYCFLVVFTQKRIK